MQIPERFKDQKIKCQSLRNLMDITTLSSNAIVALEACSADLFPNVRKLLTTLATLPVSTAIIEPSFGTMKSLKTYLKSTIGEQRLTTCFA